MTATGHKKGLWAERGAELFLLLKGYRVISRRFKTPLGEIDLVAKRGRTLVFVEVKWRETAVEAAEAIHAKNQARVSRAAALYLQQHPQYTDMDTRFDAVVMARGVWPRHIEGAW